MIVQLRKWLKCLDTMIRKYFPSKALVLVLKCSITNWVIRWCPTRLLDWFHFSNSLRVDSLVLLVCYITVSYREGEIRPIAYFSIHDAFFFLRSRKMYIWVRRTKKRSTNTHEERKTFVVSYQMATIQLWPHKPEYQ